MVSVLDIFDVSFAISIEVPRLRLFYLTHQTEEDCFIDRRNFQLNIFRKDFAMRWGYAMHGRRTWADRADFSALDFFNN